MSSITSITKPSDENPSKMMLLKPVSSVYNFRDVTLLDKENEPANLKNIVRYAANLPSFVNLQTNASRLSEIRFVGLGDYHGNNAVREANSNLAALFFSVGNEILVEDSKNPKFTSMLEMSRFVSAAFKRWDSSFSAQNNSLNNVDTLIIIQRMIYMIKRDMQYLFHKKNRSNESFDSIFETLKKTLLSHNPKDFKRDFHSELLDTKDPYNALYKAVTKHKLDKSANPHYLLSLIGFDYTVNIKKFVDEMNIKFTTRQKSLVHHAKNALMTSHVTILVAGKSHLFDSKGIMDGTVSHFINKNQIKYLCSLPEINSTAVESTLPPDIDFSTIFNSIQKGSRHITNIDLLHFLNKKLATLSSLVNEHYRPDGTIIPSQHFKHSLPAKGSKVEKSS